MRRLIHAFYNSKFSFREFLDRNPEHRRSLILRKAHAQTGAAQAMAFLWLAGARAMRDATTSRCARVTQAGGRAKQGDLELLC
jgi:hypothetical protein